MASDIVDNTRKHRFELPIAGDDVAVAYYQTDAHGRVSSRTPRCRSAIRARGSDLDSRRAYLMPSGPTVGR
jgi:hypothetical protein